MITFSANGCRVSLSAGLSTSATTEKVKRVEMYSSLRIKTVVDKSFVNNARCNKSPPELLTLRFLKTGNAVLLSVNTLMGGGVMGQSIYKNRTTRNFSIAHMSVFPNIFVVS